MTGSGNFDGEAGPSAVRNAKYAGTARKAMNAVLFSRFFAEVRVFRVLSRWAICDLKSP
jgi:hypothetical protein